ncbi:TIGR02922 family protein [Parashewanella spongiae]|nr:DUF2375 family protein [Parashewanella spongiae]MCL1078059.1 TIGR02922 family protein [Parashewanella spongiae]
MTDKITITVLYYDAPISLTIKTEVLTNITQTKDKRIVLPHDYKKAKVIVAVFEGDCQMLNFLGERAIH